MDLDNNHLRYQVEQTAKENLENGKDLHELMLRKSSAFRSLMLLPHKLTDTFCFDYFESLTNILKITDPSLEKRKGYRILNGYMNISTNLGDKLLLLQTLTICLIEGKVDFSVFADFPSNEWRKELLLFSLVGDFKLDEVLADLFINKINNLKNVHDQKVIDNVLELLVDNRNQFEVSLCFMNDLFFAISHYSHILVLCSQSRNLHTVQDEINQIKLNMITSSCLRFSDFSLEEHLSDIKYYLKFPFEVIKILIASESLQNLLDLKCVLEICDMDLTSQIQIIAKHNPFDQVNKLINEIVFEIVRNVIANIFPPYEKYSLQVDKTSMKHFSNLHLVSSSDVKCTCFKVNEDTKCFFHHSTECCDLLYGLNVTIAKVLFNNCSDHLLEMKDLTIDLISRVYKPKKIIEYINLLDTLDDYNYNKQFTNEELHKFLSEITAEDYEIAFHEYIIENSFPGTYIKSVDQLLDEIAINNNQTIGSSIVEMYAGVYERYEKGSTLEQESKIPIVGPIKSWNKQTIALWVAYVRNFENAVSDEEILAVLQRAAKIEIELKLRDVQLISVLTMIKSDKGKGRLAQIGTGEGKTLIIAILAAYCVLKGHKVDVFTSSPLLAIPQSQEYKGFYELCGISVTHNINPNSRYDCDVIYGTNSSYQRDVLLDEFRKTGVRKKRKYDVAIVDEVDNMLIDGNNWILKLSSDMPAMDYLEVLLAAIYIQVHEAASSLVERNGQTYYLVQENAIDDQGNVKSNIDVKEIPIDGSKRDFILKTTEDHMRKLIRDTESYDEIEEGYPEIKIPNHLRDLICKVQLKKWIKNAVSALFNYSKDEDYILKNGKIVIVDADNTGVIKENSHWCAGLHQFLEIKHGAKIRQENFTSNFISNVGLFTRYGSKLYGLTGTLGSDDTRYFLQNTYDVDSVIIPPFKLKQHKTLKPIVVDNVDEKYIEIAKSCIRKLRCGRAVLIIMKYIKETDELAKIFCEHFGYDSSKIKLFKTDDDSDVVENLLQPGDVVITTNIAGRGTDIKISKKVEKNGGLHVCLTFLPLNSRVEHQNIGRSSRKGNKGTSQLVLYDKKEKDIMKLKSKRNIKEMNIMKRASNTVKIIKQKDQIFHKFCGLLGEIKGRHPDFKETELKSVEERFAFWLIENEDNLDGDSDEVYSKFNEFMDEILEDDRENKLIKNPYMYVELGNKLLNEKKYEQAIEEYTNAILLDHCFSEHAFYNRAWAYLNQYGHDIAENIHFINEAIRDLKRARKLIKEKEYCLHLLQTASRGEVFSEQVSHKLNLYSIQNNTIELAIGPDIEAVDEQIKDLKKDLEKDNLPIESKEKINECIDNLKETKKDIGVIGRAMRNNRNIIIEPLEEDFMPKEDKESHKDELAEFKRNGWKGGFKITEVKPIDWASVIGLMAIGLGQIIIGAALTVFTLGAGASIGMGLISEGVSDIITAVKDGIINREFDWAMWALMKVISIAVSVVCAGLKAIKDAARTAYTGTKTFLSQGAKVFTEVGKTGWKIVAKKMGVEMAKGVAKEIVTDLISYGIDKTMIPMIEEMIIENVRTPIQEALIKNSKVEQMLKLDEQNQNNFYQNQIKNIALNLLAPEQNSMLKTIATQIATKVVDHQGTKYAMTRQICNGLIGVYELTTFTTSFINKMNEAINDINITSNTESGSPGGAHANTDSTESSTYEQETVFKDEDEDVDINKIGRAEQQVQKKAKVQNTDSLSDELAGLVSTKMVGILKGKIVRPITQMGVNYSVDKLSSKLHSVDKEMENYRSLKNIIHYQNNPRNNGNHSCTSEDIQKVDEIIERVENGGPGGLVHMGAMCEVTDKPIIIYDEKGRTIFTIGDSRNTSPIEVEYHAPKDGSDVGHYTLKGCREPNKEGTAKNMCLFNVIAEHTGQDPNDLKSLTLEAMRNNKPALANQMKHVRRLQMYDKASLFEGGAQYNGRNPDHAKSFIRNANGVIGFGNINAGHTDKHIPFKGKTIDRLNAIAEATGKQIELHDEHGNYYIVGKKPDSKENVERIMLQYHKPKGDTSAEYFSSIGGKEKYYMHDPNDTTFYDIISKQTGLDATTLKSETTTRMEQMSVPPQKTCIENEKRKTGFMSEDEAAFVLDHALKTPAAKKAMTKLNQYKEGVNDSEPFKKQEVKISAKELNLPRTAYGGQWNKGKLQISWPVKDVVIVLQHYDGHESNPDARVHIQTFFPRPP